MNLYKNLKESQQTRLNNFLKQSAFFAFDKEQFKKGLERLGLPADGENNVISIGGGGYILESKANDFRILLERSGAERQAALDDPETGGQFALDMFIFELRNHEYGYTGDPEETLTALGYTQEDIDNSPRLQNALSEAKKIVLQEEY